MLHYLGGSGRVCSICLPASVAEAALLPALSGSGRPEEIETVSNCLYLRGAVKLAPGFMLMYTYIYIGM